MIGIEQRFWGKVNKTETCWLWTGAITAAGYGELKINGLPIYAHRLSYEQFRGSIPEGLQLDHLCRQRQCVKPEHLEIVTLRENVIRGQGIATRANLTHCIHGHPFDLFNTYFRENGTRACRSCWQIRNERRDRH